MAQKLEDWLDTEVEELCKLPVGDLSNTFFFRDPMRPNYIDYQHFYSPADGVILYQKIVEDITAIFELKKLYPISVLYNLLYVFINISSLSLLLI